MSFNPGQIAICHTSRFATEVVSEAYQAVIVLHGEAIIHETILGAALNSPRSAIPNYAELLVALVQRVPNQTRDWVTGILRNVGIRVLFVGRGGPVLTHQAASPLFCFKKSPTFQVAKPLQKPRKSFKIP